MDWFKGKFTGTHRFSHEIEGFPVNFPLNQSIDNDNQDITMTCPMISRILPDQSVVFRGSMRDEPSQQLLDPMQDTFMNVMHDSN